MSALIAMIATILAVFGATTYDVAYDDGHHTTIHVECVDMGARTWCPDGSVFNLND